MLPSGSSDQPGDRPGILYPPIWSCSRWGLPCLLDCSRSGELLPRHFTLTPSTCAPEAVCFLWHRPSPGLVTGVPHLRGASRPMESGLSSPSALARLGAAIHPSKLGNQTTSVATLVDDGYSDCQYRTRPQKSQLIRVLACLALCMICGGKCRWQPPQLPC